MTYSSRNEAIETEIIQPIEAGGEITNARADFDIDAIADEVLGDYYSGYAPRVDADEFWEIVEKHETPIRLTNAQLRTARRIIGLSGQELANRLGIRSDTLRRWESGRDEIPYRVREELAKIAAERARSLTATVQALTSNSALPLTPETVVESKGWRGTLQEVQTWLWDSSHIIEANLIAKLRDENRIPGIDEDDDDALENDDVCFLDTLPVLTFADVKDLLDDNQAQLI